MADTTRPERLDNSRRVYPHNVYTKHSNFGITGKAAKRKSPLKVVVIPKDGDAFVRRVSKAKVLIALGMMQKPKVRGERRHRRMPTVSIF